MNIVLYIRTHVPTRRLISGVLLLCIGIVTMCFQAIPHLAEASAQATSTQAQTQTLTPTTTQPSGAARRLPDAWKLVDLLDSHRPALLMKGEGATYHVDPAWTVSGIEHRYAWTVHEKDSEIYQHDQITRVDGAYLHGSVPVAESAVRELVSALSDLYPTPFALSDEEHGLAWAVDLAGIDGQHILIYTYVSGRPDSSPWTVYYNGRLYTQFGGKLTEVINRLFPGPRHTAPPGYSNRQAPDGNITFVGDGYPVQFEQGFMGLLPLADALMLQADRATKTITGTIIGAESASTPDEQTESSFALTDLIRVETLTDPAHPAACVLDAMTLTKSHERSWTFHCPLPPADPSARTTQGALISDDGTYDVPIRVVYSSAYEQNAQTEGRLVGRFHDADAQLYIPFDTHDPESHIGLKEDAALRDLLQDHVLVRFDTQLDDFQVTVSPGAIGDAPRVIAAHGVASLLGQFTVEGETVRYRLKTVYTLKDGEGHWAIKRDGLVDMLKTISEMPLTQALIQRRSHSEPPLTLDISMMDGPKTPDSPLWFSANFASCPYKVNIPNATEGFRGFSYHLKETYMHPDFIFTHGYAIAYGLELTLDNEAAKSAGDDSGITFVRTDPLRTRDGKTFTRVTLLNSEYQRSPFLLLTLPKNIDSQARDSLRTLAESLPGHLLEGDAVPDSAWASMSDRETYEYWALDGATFIAGFSGELLAINACEIPATPTPTSTPANTPNPTPARTATPLDLSRLTSWNTYDPSDPNRPQLIIPDGTAYRLKPGWGINRVEYVAKWWGLGVPPTFDYQILVHDSTGYRIDTQPVAPALVDALLAAITNLRPVSTLVDAIDHTDDYPSWQLELTGTDGEHILLVSQSQPFANGGAVPWNVIYNGRIYAHLDTTLGDAIGALFKSELSNPVASTGLGGAEPGTIFYSSDGLPPQITDGFVGLLPIADSFQYRIDLRTATLHGMVTGRSSILGTGNLVIGNITTLSSVTLEPTGGPLITCAINAQQSQDPDFVGWAFTCPLGTLPLTSEKGGKTGQPRYDYAIKVAFGTDKGKVFTTDGRLQGALVDRDEHTLLTIPAVDVVQPLSAGSAYFADLMRDHLLYVDNYKTVVDVSSQRVKKMTGTAVLIGMTTIGGKPIRYTVSTPFLISEGRVEYWTVRRPDLQRMLAQIAALPLTQRIYAAKPDTLLNLHYAESGSDQDYPYSSEPLLCSTSERVQIPDSEPYRTFSFDGGVTPNEFASSLFALVKGQVSVLSGGPDPSDPNTQPTLWPREFDDLLSRKVVSISFLVQKDGPTITVFIVGKATESDLDAVRAVVEKLPGKATFKSEKDNDGTLYRSWEISGIWPILDVDGRLHLAACSAK